MASLSAPPFVRLVGGRRDISITSVSSCWVTLQVVFVQRAYRAYQIRCLLFDPDGKKTKAAIMMQRHVRRFQVRAHTGPAFAGEGRGGCGNSVKVLKPMCSLRTTVRRHKTEASDRSRRLQARLIVTAMRHVIDHQKDLVKFAAAKTIQLAYRVRHLVRLLVLLGVGRMGAVGIASTPESH